MSEANDFKIELLQEEDLDYVISMCEAIFREHDTMASDPLKMEFFTQLNVSYKALLNGEIIGCYLMNEDPVIHEHEGFVINVDISPYDEKKGIHGVVLALKPEFRGKGYGRRLRDIPRTLGRYDYVWGYNVKSLGNIDNWLKYGRRIIGESDACYVTLMDLNDKCN